jgi:hypothetical protein
MCQELKLIDPPWHYARAVMALGAWMNYERDYDVQLQGSVDILRSLARFLVWFSGTDY